MPAAALPAAQLIAWGSGEYACRQGSDGDDLVRLRARLTARLHCERVTTLNTSRLGDDGVRAAQAAVALRTSERRAAVGMAREPEEGRETRSRHDGPARQRSVRCQFLHADPSAVSDAEAENGGVA